MFLVQVFDGRKLQYLMVLLCLMKVDGKDLRNAAHDQAVDIIRHAKSPVRFVVQSLCDPACVSPLIHIVKYGYNKRAYKDSCFQ